MTGLVLKLRPFEKLLINGAVLQNGARATRLRVRSADATVLRLRDALHPRDAASQAGRIYYIAQLAVAGEAEPGAALAELSPLIDDALGAAGDERAQAALLKAREAALAGRLFSVMRAIKPLLAAEAPPPGAP
ncbi:MAG TPA: flagellar biosynthesis repressor FlbT [Parvularcula sp.]|nr:flagellar biosynthesis repressor FlbT [Parvularcula sp.]HBS30967.1 flagellar biosynthesis repressor FlbT [Parvularcula sp.]HBS34968.1 flagellar biosynthesis repressor FlbT [Parvularcula sp.]